MTRIVFYKFALLLSNSIKEFYNMNVYKQRKRKQPQRSDESMT